MKYLAALVLLLAACAAPPVPAVPVIPEEPPVRPAVLEPGVPPTPASPADLRAELADWPYLRHITGPPRGGAEAVRIRRGAALLDQLAKDPSLRDNPAFLLEFLHWAGAETESGDQGVRMAQLLNERRERLFREAAKAQTFEQKRKLFETRARRALREVGVAQELFRLEDPDGNKAEDYWVGNVSGLYRVLDRNGNPAALLDPAIARADLKAEVKAPGHPAMAPLENREPYFGYRFAALRSRGPAGAPVAFDSGTGRHAKSFGVVAVPVEYGKTGLPTFLIDESLTIYKKDTKGEVPDRCPEDPVAEGWIP